jgi:hypothetical protein
MRPLTTTEHQEMQFSVSLSRLCCADLANLLTYRRTGILHGPARQICRALRKGDKYALGQARQTPDRQSWDEILLHEHTGHAQQGSGQHHWPHDIATCPDHQLWMRTPEETECLEGAKN